MDDIEILKLENKALRAKNEYLSEQLKIAMRALMMTKRCAEIAQRVGQIQPDELEMAQKIFGA